MVTWSKERQCVMQKSEQFNIRQLQEGPNSEYQQCLVVYDICYLNGRVLTSLPLWERSKLLEANVKERKGRLVVAARQHATSTQEIVTALNCAIDRREEGLVVKDINSTYRPNGRFGAGWFKVKPDYCEGIYDQLDLAIVGGYYGSGRMGGRVDQFLVAVRDDAGNEAVCVPVGLQAQPRAAGEGGRDPAERALRGWPLAAVPARGAYQAG